MPHSVVSSESRQTGDQSVELRGTSTDVFKGRSGRNGAWVRGEKHRVFSTETGWDASRVMLRRRFERDERHNVLAGAQNRLRWAKTTWYGRKPWDNPCRSANTRSTNVLPHPGSYMKHLMCVHTLCRIVMWRKVTVLQSLKDHPGCKT